MKSRILNIVVTLSAVTALTLSVLAGPGGKINVSVPFTFYVNGAELPAGNYDVRSSTNGIIGIRNRENPEEVSFSMQRYWSAPKGKQARLLFHRYGSQYFLVEVQDGAATHVLPTNRGRATDNTDHLSMNVEPELITIYAQ